MLGQHVQLVVHCIHFVRVHVCAYVQLVQFVQALLDSLVACADAMQLAAIGACAVVQKAYGVVILAPRHVFLVVHKIQLVI